MYVVRQQKISLIMKTDLACEDDCVVKDSKVLQATGDFKKSQKRYIIHSKSDQLHMHLFSETNRKTN